MLTAVEQLNDVLKRMNSAPAYKWWGEFTRELDRIIQDEAAIAALADVLPHCNTDIRRWFARKIGKIRPELVPDRLGFLTNDPDEDVQIEALTAYHAANALNEKTLKLVRELVRSGRLIVFQDAVKILSERHDPQLPGLLEALFPCKDVNLRGRLVHALVATGEPGMEALNRLAHHSDTETRAISVIYLGPSSSETILLRLHDGAETVRSAAAHAAGRTGLASAEERLLKLAENPATLDGRSALEALGQLHSQLAWPLLVKTLQSKEFTLCVLGAEIMVTAGYAGSEAVICSRYDEVPAEDVFLRWWLIKIVAKIATGISIPRFEKFLEKSARFRRLMKSDRKEARRLLPVWIFKARQREAVDPH